MDQRSPIAVAAEAVKRAEDGLVGLPPSDHVRKVHSHVLALRTVIPGIVAGVPVLNGEQIEKPADDAGALAGEVARSSWGCR